MSGLHWWDEAVLFGGITTPTGRVLAFDVDSVLFPVNEVAVLPALRRAGYDIQLEDIVSFDYAEAFDPEVKRIAFEQFTRPDLYDGHTLTKLQKVVLDRLRERNRVIAVSSPFEQHASSKWRYCLRAGFEHNDIVLCGDKTLVDFDVLVDDRPETLLALGNRRAVTFDRPWNREVSGLHRAHGWKEVLPAIVRVLGEEAPVGRRIGAAIPVARATSATCTHGRTLLEPCESCGVAGY